MGGLLEPGALSTEPSVHKSLKDYKTAMNSIREGNNSSLRPEDETIDGFLVNQMSLRFKEVSRTSLNKHPIKRLRSERAPPFFNAQSNYSLRPNETQRPQYVNQGSGESE